MSKDRFKELQANIEKHGDGVDISIINHFAVIDMEAPFLEDFFNEVDALRSDIHKISKLIDDAEYLQHAMLVPQIIKGTKERLEEKMAKVKPLGQQIRKKLTEMKQVHESQYPIREKNICQRIIESQIEEMTKKFCMIMDKYYTSVIAYREKCKERVQRQYEIAGFVKTDEEIEDLLENGRFTMHPEIIIKTEQAKEQLDLMELRHQGLIELEDSIRDLHDMMFDIAQLVSSEGNQINDIANKTQHIGYTVIKATPTIGARKVSHCFPFKKKICFLVISAIFIVLLILRFIIF